MTDEEIVALARRIARHEVAPDQVDWGRMAEHERDRVLAFAVYEMRVGWKKGNRRAMRLLRAWLDATQRESLRRNGWFYVRGSGGGMYRLQPQVGHVERVEKHGKNWFGKFRYCFHDAEGILPPADVTLAHLLHLVTDEADFLARANATPQCANLWSGEYRRRLRDARLRRVAEAAAWGCSGEVSCQWSTGRGCSSDGRPESRDVVRVPGLRARVEAGGAVSRRAAPRPSSARRAKGRRDGTAPQVPVG